MIEERITLQTSCELTNEMKLNLFLGMGVAALSNLIHYLDIKPSWDYHQDKINSISLS